MEQHHKVPQAGFVKRVRLAVALTLILPLVVTSLVLRLTHGGSPSTSASSEPALLLALAPGHIETYAGGLKDPHDLPTRLKIWPISVTSAGPHQLLIADATGKVIWLVNSSSRSVSRWGRTIPAGQMAIVAGDSGVDYGGNGALATESGMQPDAMLLDPAGNLYIADQANHLVLRVAASSGVITVVAGTLHPKGIRDGGPAIDAELSEPSGIAMDANGNLFIADAVANRIRKVTAATGKITTIAGTGKVGPNGSGSFSGDGGPAIRAALNGPTGLVLDSAGNLYVADTDNNRVRRVDSRSGMIITVAGNGRVGSYIGDGTYSGDGRAATAAGLSYPMGMALDSVGNLYIADAGNNRIRMVAAGSKIIRTVVGSGPLGLYQGAFGGDGEPVAQAQLDYPVDVAVTSDGTLFIADSFNGRVRVIGGRPRSITTLAGSGMRRNSQFGTFSGDGGPAPQAGLDEPSGAAVNAAGNLYIVDSNNGRVRMVTAATGIISTVAGTGSGARDSNNQLAGPDTGDGGPAIRASLNVPDAVAVDAAGNLYVTTLERIRRVAVGSGIITTVAGNGRDGYSGDGGPATKASLSQPTGLAVDSAGNLYIADSHNGRVRKISARTGIISTVAGNGQDGLRGIGGPATRASLGEPLAIALDRAGNLYITGDGIRVFKVMATSGIVSTVAGSGQSGFSGDGGPATAAQFLLISGLAVDGAGNLYIADALGFRVRKVAVRTGIISTVAGKLVPDTSRPVDGVLNLPYKGTYGGDGGPAAQAGLYSPTSLAIDRHGNLYIVDTLNHRVRVVRSAAETAGR